MKSITRFAIALLGFGFVGLFANCHHDEPPPPEPEHHYYHHHSNAPENFEPVNRY